MYAIDIINKKRRSESLSKEELQFMIDQYLEGHMLDYQMSAFLMAICCNGMSEEETIFMTEVMLNSGDKIDLSTISGIKVDKHSTGGVGDKTTLVLAPLVASTGVNIAKMSGRSLGHTGGTIDKLESIPGFTTSISLEAFVQQVNDIHLALVGQMGNLVPADKKVYALRDVTGTVESIPLIASSIMSKKLASGADKIIIDVKVGNGALIKTTHDAKTLAYLMVKIGNSFGKETICILSDMEQPLGYAIGNALEVLESIQILKGEGPNDVNELVVTLATYMVSLGKKISEEDAKKEVIQNLHNGKAYQKFKEFIETQGGDLDKIQLAPKVFSIKSPKMGYIKSIDTYQLGEIVSTIGAGRHTLEDQIDFGVGVVLNKKVGDFVLKEEELLKVYLHKIDIGMREILDCFTITSESVNPRELIYEVIK